MLDDDAARTGAVESPDPAVTVTSPRGRPLVRWIATRVAALVIFVAAWQLVVISGWKPQFLVPSPFTVLDALVHDPGAFAHDAGISLTRAAIGLGAAIVVGGVIGVVAACVHPLRAPLRSLVAGLQTLPPVVWYPAALIVIGLSTPTILLVITLGATPLIALGIIDGAAEVPTRREGSTAGRVTRLRRVALPAALPRMLAGLRSGWGACWAALLTGEILLTLPSLGLGGQLAFNRGLNDYVAVYEGMIVIFLIGVLVDGAIFGGATVLLRRQGRAAAA